MRLSRFLLALVVYLVLGVAWQVAYGQESTVCSGDCTVTVILTPAEIDQARVDDLNAMFALFISAVVVVYFGRQLLKLFDKDPYES